jgi:hypothetical protein
MSRGVAVNAFLPSRAKLYSKLQQASVKMWHEEKYRTLLPHHIFPFQ